MKVLLLVITDNRLPCLRLTMEGVAKYMSAQFSDWVMVDDSANSEFQDRIHYYYPNFRIVSNERNLGFGLTMARAWGIVRECKCDYVFNLQNDFVLRRRVYLTHLIEVMQSRPDLIQMSLRRQPVNQKEKDAGGFVELFPQAYRDMEWNGYHWLEHNMRFTMNPAIIPGWVANEDWPQPPYCESQFGVKMRERGYKMGIWGKREDPPLVEHIGDVRTRPDGY